MNLIKNWAIKKYDLVDADFIDGLVDTYNKNLRTSLEKHKPYTKYDSLEEYKKQVYFKDTIMQYSGGRGKPKPLHKFLVMTDAIELLYLNFLKYDLRVFNCRFKDPDDLIFKLNIRLNNWLEPVEKYESDKGEHWKTPELLIKLGANSISLGDCEDVSIFKYCCFKTALKYKGWWDTTGLRHKDYPWNNKWRLRLVWSQLIHGEHHVHLAWCRDGKHVGWFPLESTYHPELFEKWWNSGVRLEYDNPLYDVQKTWTDEKEFKRLL